MLAVAMIALSLGAGHMDVVPRPNALTAASRRPARYVPAPRAIRFVRGTPDGADPATFEVGTLGSTVYSTEPMGRFARAHETGHVFDNTVLTDGDRHYFTRLFGLKGPWERQERIGGQDGSYASARSPDEWFADYYAADRVGMVMRGPHRTPIQGAYAQYTPKRLAQFEAALTRLGHRRHLGSLI